MAKRKTEEKAETQANENTNTGATEEKAEATATQQAQQGQEEQAPSIEAKLNPAAELSVYEFADGAGFKDGVKYALTEEQFEKYRGTKVRGHQVVVKA